MTKFKIAGATAAAALISACAGPQFREDKSATPVVELRAVINALKCGLATALISDQSSRAGLRGAIAKVELDVNVVQGVAADGEIKAGIPVSGGAFTPSLTLGYSQVRSVNSSIDLDIALRANDASICQKVEADLGRDAGFSTWMNGVVAQLYQAEAGDPKATLKQYVYESNFTVKRTGKFGLSAEIIPVKFSTSFGSSRDDIQKMKITIDPVHYIKDKKGQWKPAPGAVPFFHAPSIRSLGTDKRRGNFLLESQ